MKPTLSLIKTYGCDRCGTLFEVSPASDPSVIYEAKNGPSDLTEYRLCPSCYAKFLSFMEQSPSYSVSLSTVQPQPLKRPR